MANVVNVAEHARLKIQMIADTCYPIVNMTAYKVDQHWLIMTKDGLVYGPFDKIRSVFGANLVAGAQVVEGPDTCGAREFTDFEIFDGSECITDGRVLSAEEALQFISKHALLYQDPNISDNRFMFEPDSNWDYWPEVSYFKVDCVGEELKQLGLYIVKSQYSWRACYGLYSYTDQRYIIEPIYCGMTVTPYGVVVEDPNTKLQSVFDYDGNIVSSCSYRSINLVGPGIGVISNADTFIGIGDDERSQVVDFWCKEDKVIDPVNIGYRSYCTYRDFTIVYCMLNSRYTQLLINNRTGHVIARLSRFKKYIVDYFDAILVIDNTVNTASRKVTTTIVKVYWRADNSGEENDEEIVQRLINSGDYKIIRDVKYRYIFGKKVDVSKEAYGEIESDLLGMKP